jgi:bifunctional oligoribonuclease and PAP phosphatase NrnA
MTMPQQILASDAEDPVVYEIAEAIREHQTFLVLGHLRPDGDCLGSGLGMCELLRSLGKEAQFFTKGPLQEIFAFLPGHDRIITEPPTTKHDVYIYVDSGDPDRVSEEFHPKGFIINIDHHLSNTRFGTLNWVDVEATAAGEQIYRLADVMKQPITPALATCLYTAILTDTGGFRFSNTDQMTFRVAAKLVESGADPAKIAGQVYESRKPQSVQLIGEVYASLRYEFDGRFVWTEIRQELFDKVGGEDVEPEGLSSDIRGIAGVEVSALFYETPEDFCRLGLRSKSKVNVSELAQSLGGGGHYNASGAMIREPYEQARDRALQAVREYLKTHL